MQFKSKYIVPIGADGIHTINTGDWRTQRPSLDQEICIRCGTCLLYCPVGSIHKNEGGEFYVCYDYCKGCGVCAHECPKKAIIMTAEGGK